MKSRTFVDTVTVYARAGNGGNGCVSFRREKFIPKGGPSGGDGGRGGHVILQADPNEDSLVRLYYAPHQRAEHGEHGRGKDQYGRGGRDLIVRVPCGTVVWNAETGDMIADLVAPGAQVIAARGGRGGLGNIHWKSSTHRAPREHTDGEPGQEVTLRLELRLIADVGLVGFPNAGKSSLLSRLSDAHPKIAAYPFTTLHPIIGTLSFDDFTRMTLADIPGLIEGAHDGVGLGYDFLRHIERSRCLLYVIDMAGVDGRDPYGDYRTLKREIQLYDASLLKRPSLVIANKMDLAEARSNLPGFQRRTRTRPRPVSAETGEGLDKLRDALREMHLGHL